MGITKFLLGVAYTIDIDSKKRWIWAFNTGSVLTGEANKMAGIGNLLKALKNLVAFNIWLRFLALEMY